ncbi:FAD-dependent thymidylate synthase [Candidatus Saccharibacteria bacterium]|nr:FAD-dependent thymidylate synthase [Candidatus Saccharibacteria bacterium]
MEIRVVGRSKRESVFSLDGALDMVGLASGICYMSDDFDTLASTEDSERRIERARSVLERGHHSVAGHVYYNLLIEDAPKIIAMILNNEQIYDTSEKSARYTKMRLSGREAELYEKWQGIFEDLISKTYPGLSGRQVKKFALENARFFISVFAPSTTMMYTINLRQANYIVAYCDHFLNSDNRELMVSPHFLEKLRPYITKLRDQLHGLLGVENLVPPKEFGHFSLFACERRKEEFGESYSVNYTASLTQLAQAQRHRKISYELSYLSDAGLLYEPPILKQADVARSQEYLDDLKSIVDDFPQALQVIVNERGLFESFVRKCGERLCGDAQLEICLRSYETAKRYHDALKRDVEMGLNHHARKVEVLERILEGNARCCFSSYNCHKACFWGPRHIFDRLI